MILLDTHVVVWLYADPNKLIPSTVRQRLDDEQIALSPFVILELQYLYEIEKISVPADTIVKELVPKLEIVVTDPASASICQAALTMSWTRDPFDRLISAHAAATQTELVTRDRRIRENLPLAWWKGR